MNKIFVIGTIHSIGGNCSSDALLKLIQEISPNVIFCEAPPEKFPAMLKATETFNTPEIKALRAINEQRSIEIIPIDLNDDPFDRRLEAMHELFSKKINEHYYASEIQFNEAHLKGFPYLNSKESDQIFKDKDSMEKIFVSRVNHAELSKTHRDWLQWNDKRENHWINSIHDYVKQNQINVAVFLIGAAHRIRLIEKIKSVNDMLTPAWDFYPFK
jgi:hypothetical protein